MKDLLMLYRNYLFAIQERREYGDKYGDTDELMRMYEEKLKIKSLEKRENDESRRLCKN